MALDPKTKETIREEALRLSKEFAELDGRRPRVLLIEMEIDLESDREIEIPFLQAAPDERRSGYHHGHREQVHARGRQHSCL